MAHSIPIETLFYILGEVDFTVESDGAIRICCSNERDGDVDLTIAADVGFLLHTLFRLPGVRQLITREELVRQRARHWEHVKAVVASERQLAGEKYGKAA